MITFVEKYFMILSLVGVKVLGKVLNILGNCKNVRGLGKSKVVFRLFEKLRY